MRAFWCDTCGRLVYFENSACLNCGTELGFDPSEGRIVTVDSLKHRRCANDAATCNWLVPFDDPGHTSLCTSCRLTRTRPADDGPETSAAFATAEAAKRRLVFQLLELGLPLVGWMDEPGGLAFDLLSSRSQPVTTGHAKGVITLDLAESDDVHRVRLRTEFDEPYRTVLGHLRHEIGHYYWPILVQQRDRLDAFRECFGDDRQDYQAALASHYGDGTPPSGWKDRYVSMYAAAHPWEDWAETFAHYLHIRDTLQTAVTHGVQVDHPMLDRARAEPADSHDEFLALLDEWLPLTFALNAVNRSMGRADLYPFVIRPAVITKLAWVHESICGDTSI